MENTTWKQSHAKSGQSLEANGHNQEHPWPPEMGRNRKYPLQDPMKDVAWNVRSWRLHSERRPVKVWLNVCPYLTSRGNHMRMPLTDPGEATDHPLHGFCFQRIDWGQEWEESSIAPVSHLCFIFSGLFYETRVTC